MSIHILIDLDTINQSAGVQNVDAESGADNPDDSIGDGNDDHAGRATRHHLLGFVYFSFVTTGGDPVEATEEEVEGKRDGAHNGQDYEDIRNKFFHGTS